MTNLLLNKVNYFSSILKLDKNQIIINNPFDIKKDYDQYWPSVDDSGVYAFYSEEGKLLYIGSTNNIASRMSGYFKYAKDGSGKPINKISRGTRWVVIIGFNKKYYFLAPALEQFLLNEVSTERNKSLIKK